MVNDTKKPGTKVVIHIDKSKFEAPQSSLTGTELRALGSVPPGRTLWKEVPGGDDEVVEADASVELKNGMHFYSVAGSINPG